MWYVRCYIMFVYEYVCKSVGWCWPIENHDLLHDKSRLTTWHQKVKHLLTLLIYVILSHNKWWRLITRKRYCIGQIINFYSPHITMVDIELRDASVLIMSIDYWKRLIAQLFKIHNTDESCWSGRALEAKYSGNLMTHRV